MGGKYNMGRKVKRVIKSSDHIPPSKPSTTSSFPMSQRPSKPTPPTPQDQLLARRGPSPSDHMPPSKPATTSSFPMTSQRPSKPTPSAPQDQLSARRGPSPLPAQTANRSSPQPNHSVTHNGAKPSGTGAKPDLQKKPLR